MSRPVGCFTSFSYSYLPRARILVQTIRATHPDWAVYAVVVDKPPAGLAADALAEFDGVVDAEALGVPGFRSWIFKHDLVEACTAVKGRMLLELLGRGFDKVIYLDPDIAVFHPLHDIVRRLDDASVILTPHQTEPNDSTPAFRDNELTSMRYGIYNLGFVAVRGDWEGNRFANWWAQQLHAACYDDVANGVFTDQKYCDLVPGLFDRVHIERDPGCNVASWNLSRRTIRFAHDGLTVNGSPLKFYHFTKIGSEGDVMTERYAGDNTEVFEVWRWYKRRLVANQVAGIPPGYWHYGCFADGQALPKPVRLLYRGRSDLMAAFADPFATGEGCFLEWLQQNEPHLLAGTA